MGLQVNLMLPWRKMGEPQSGDGAFSNTPPTAFLLESCIVNTGESARDAKGEWRVGQREPNETPDALQESDGA